MVSSTAASTVSVTAASSASSGTWTVSSRAPTRPVHRVAAIRTAPYMWSVTSTASPDASRRPENTVLAAVVAFCTNAVPSGSAPRKAATSARAWSSASGSSRLKNRVGLVSMRSRQDCCSSRTARGTAP